MSLSTAKNLKKLISSSAVPKSDVCIIRNFSVCLPKMGKDKYQVTLETIFSDSHKQHVQNLKKLGSSHAIPQTDRIKVELKRQSAVLVPMCHIDGKPSFLFMKRSKHLKSHSGEISFPGGMKDPGDPDLIFTALRETFEEIGLPQEQVNIWGCLPPSPSSTSGSLATPVLGYCGELDLSQLKINHSEVELVFTRTVASLCDLTNIRQTQMRLASKAAPKGYVLPVFLGGEHRIWGLTGMILHQVLGAIAPGLYKFRLRFRS